MTCHPQARRDSEEPLIPGTRSLEDLEPLARRRVDPQSRVMAYGARPLNRPATLADLEALPENVTGEIIEGTLYAHARPRPGHSDIYGDDDVVQGAPFEAIELRLGDLWPPR